jgi:hypothetical protein
MICSICKEKVAVQEHHLSYNPEIKINVCIPCHRLLHNHGVGREWSSNRKSYSPQENPITPPSFTKEITKDGVTYIVTKQSEEILNWCKCPNDSNLDWQLYQSPSTKQYFLRCPRCGFDVFFNREG